MTCVDKNMSTITTTITKNELATKKNHREKRLPLEIKSISRKLLGHHVFMSNSKCELSFLSIRALIEFRHINSTSRSETFLHMNGEGTMITNRREN